MILELGLDVQTGLAMEDDRSGYVSRWAIFNLFGRLNPTGSNAAGLRVNGGDIGTILTRTTGSTTPN